MALKGPGVPGLPGQIAQELHYGTWQRVYRFHRLYLLVKQRNVPLSGRCAGKVESQQTQEVPGGGEMDEWKTNQEATSVDSIFSL